MSKAVRCPVHKKILKLERKKLDVLGREYDVVAGFCPKCKGAYIGTILEKCPRFVIDGTLYCSIPELDEYQNESKEELLNQKIQLQNDRLERAKIDEIRKRELKEQEKERKRQELERKKQEEEQKKAEERKRQELEIRKEKKKQEEEKRRQEKEQQRKLLEKEEKLNAAMPKTIYVLRDLNYKVCPVCKKKIAFNPVSLTLQGGKGKIKNAVIMGYSCPRCHAVFIPERIAEKEFLEQYTEYLNLDYLETKIQEIRRQETEQQKENEKYKERFPFLTDHKIEVNVEKSAQKKCPKHKNSLKLTGWNLTRKKGEQEQLLYGYYCKQCNIMYISEKEQKKVDKVINKYGLQKSPFKILPVELKKTRLEPAEVTFSGGEKIKYDTSNEEIQKIKKIELRWSKTEFEQTAHKKYEKEIAEIAACVDGEERHIRILTSVSEEDRWKSAPEDMLVREAEILGRELLGRIAHGQLDEFYAKNYEITIHQYKVWPGQDHHLDGFTKFSNPEKMQDITIMSQKNLRRDSEEYEMVTALVFCSNRQEPVYIDVYYSKRQDRYFINDESYRQYSSRYGLPYMRLLTGEYDGDVDYGNLRQYSELNLYGYTVAKSADMTTGERQALLKQLIDNGMMSKHQIVNHLEWLIHRQSGRISMEDACDCWKEDLKFVNGYKINQQRKICGRFVYGKTALR